MSIAREVLQEVLDDVDRILEEYNWDAKVDNQEEMIVMIETIGSFKRLQKKLNEVLNEKFQIR